MNLLGLPYCCSDAESSSIELCESSEELLAQEKKMELRPMKVQKLYLLSMMGKMEKAEALAADIAIEECVSKVRGPR